MVLKASWQDQCTPSAALMFCSWSGNQILHATTNVSQLLQLIPSSGKEIKKYIFKMLKRQQWEFTHQLDGPIICHLFVYPSQEQFGIHTWMKCLCGSCGIQPHIPGDLGGILPTHASGNGQTDLRSVCGPCSGLWAGSSPCQLQSRSPWRTPALDNHPQTRKPWGKSRSPVEKFQHAIGAKIIQVWMHWRG